MFLCFILFYFLKLILNKKKSAFSDKVRKIFKPNIISKKIDIIKKEEELFYIEDILSLYSSTKLDIYYGIYDYKGFSFWGYYYTHFSFLVSWNLARYEGVLDILHIKELRLLIKCLVPIKVYN